MTNFYGTTIEIKFIKQVAPMPYDGFANISRKEYEKLQKKNKHKLHHTGARGVRLNEGQTNAEIYRPS